jgi:hypothetical protein
MDWVSNVSSDVRLYLGRARRSIDAVRPWYCAACILWSVRPSGISLGGYTVGQEQLAVCGHTVRSYDQRERLVGSWEKREVDDMYCCVRLFLALIFLQLSWAAASGTA